MQIHQYKFYQEYTGTLGCLRKPLTERDESHLMRTVFGHAQAAPPSSFSAIIMPCGTGKTTLARKLSGRVEHPREALPSGVHLNVVDADRLISTHHEYDSYMDAFMHRVQSEKGELRLNSWAKLNNWRDRLIRDKLPENTKPDSVNLLLVHGKATAISCGIRCLGTVVLEEPRYDEILNRRTQRFGEDECKVMRTNYHMCKQDAHVTVCSSFQQVEDTMYKLISGLLESLRPKPTSPHIASLPSADFQLDDPQCAQKDSPTPCVDCGA